MYSIIATAEATDALARGLAAEVGALNGGANDNMIAIDVLSECENILRSVWRLRLLEKEFRQENTKLISEYEKCM